MENVLSWRCVLADPIVLLLLYRPSAVLYMHTRGATRLCSIAVYVRAHSATQLPSLFLTIQRGGPRRKEGPNFERCFRLYGGREQTTTLISSFTLYPKQMPSRLFRAPQARGVGMIGCKLVEIKSLDLTQQAKTNRNETTTWHKFS